MAGLKRMTDTVASTAASREGSPLDSETTVPYMESGRPGMIESVRGEPGGPGSFAWEAARTVG